MSIIAVKKYKDRIEIAADSFIQYDSTIITKENEINTKIMKINKDLIAGGVGSLKYTTLLCEFCKLEQPEKPTKLAMLKFFSNFNNWCNQYTNSRVENQTTFIIVYKTKVFIILDFTISEVTKYHAIGAGQDFAFAALDLNHTVDEAVKVTCKRSPLCTLPMKKYIIRKKI